MLHLPAFDFLTEFLHYFKIDMASFNKHQKSSKLVSLSLMSTGNGNQVIDCWKYVV